MFDSIKVELNLEAVKLGVINAFHQHNVNIESYVAESLSKVLSEEWIKQEIDRQINICVKKALEDISNSIELKHIITDTILNILKSKLEDNKGK